MHICIYACCAYMYIHISICSYLFILIYIHFFLFPIGLYHIRRSIFADVMATCGANGTCYVKNDGAVPFEGQCNVSTLCHGGVTRSTTWTYVKISVQMPQNVCNFTRMVHIISGFFGWSVFLLDLRCFHIFLPFGSQRFWGPRGGSWMDSGSRWSRWTWKCPRDLERSRSSRRPPVVDIVMECHRGALGWLKYHDWVAKKICKRWGGWSLFYPH